MPDPTKAERQEGEAGKAGDMGSTKSRNSSVALATEQGKEHALAKLHERRANPPKKIDNGSLQAGSPMYFYCISCGHLSDVKPELYLDAPKKLCKECIALKACGWLE